MEVVKITNQKRNGSKMEILNKLNQIELMVAKDAYLDFAARYRCLWMGSRSFGSITEYTIIRYLTCLLLLRIAMARIRTH